MKVLKVAIRNGKYVWGDLGNGFYYNFTKSIRHVSPKFAKLFGDVNAILIYEAGSFPKGAADSVIAGWDSQTHMIKIKGEYYCKEYYGAFLYSMIHEFGHVLDQHLGWISQISEFEEIFNSEKDIISKWSCGGSEYGKTSQKEYFAESLCGFLMNGDELALFAPKTYGFMDMAFNDLL